MTKSQAKVRWSAVKGATSYLVKAKSKKAKVKKAQVRTVTNAIFKAKKVKKGAKIKMTVQAVNSAGTGPAAKLVIRFKR